MKILLKIFLLIAIAVGVVYTNSNLFPSLRTWLEQTVNFPSQTKKDKASKTVTISPSPTTKKLTTTLSSARNISGQWVGSKPQGAIYRQSTICEYTADLIITFKQNNNAINGTISFITKSVKKLDTEDFTPCPPAGYLTSDFSIQGTISGTDVNFETTATSRGDPSLPIKFKGTFTSDIMSGTFERLSYSSSQLAELSRVSGTWIVTKNRQ